MLLTDRLSFKNLAILFLSLFILGILALQAGVTFWFVCPPYCPPALWPFVDYPMYSEPRYEGSEFEQHFVFGILEDSTEVPLRPEDLNLHFWLFRRGLVFAMLRNDTTQIQAYVDLYQKLHHKRLVGLRLENHPLILSREGMTPGPTRILRTFQLASREEKK